MSRKPIEITDEQKKQIMAMAGYGLRDEDISDVLGIAERTLCRKCKTELRKGRAIAIGKVAKRCFDMAVSGDHPAMTCFYLKTQAGWREKERGEEDPQDKPTPVSVRIVVEDGRNSESDS